MASRAPYVVPALKKHTATVIMAHGLGDRFVNNVQAVINNPANLPPFSGAGWYDPI